MFVLYIIIVFIGVSVGPVRSTDQPSTCCLENRAVVSLFGTTTLQFNINPSENVSSIVLRASILDEHVAEFDEERRTLFKTFQFNDEERENIRDFDLIIHGKFINRTRLDYSMEYFYVNEENRSKIENCSTILLVSAPQRFRDRFFKGFIPFIIIFVSIQMGILLDIEILKELFLRPIAIFIGFFCQYGLMPLIAFAISKLFDYSPLYGLGLFVVGCCPGGSVSNQWTVIFDGDLNLSAFMSFASTIASFFMMPFWLYTLGEYAYLHDLHIRIPFLNLAQSLLTIIGPLGLGMLLVYFFPKLKTIVQRIVKPTLFILILYFFIFGAFVNYYLFDYINLKIAVSAPLLPWLGFLLGGIFARLCGQDWKRTLTIGIETGIQNVGIAFMVLLYSFPAPENSQATVIPLIIAYLSTQPFYVILLIRWIRRRCCPSSKEEAEEKKIDRQTTNVNMQQVNNVDKEDLQKDGQSLI